MWISRETGDIVWASARGGGRCEGSLPGKCCGNNERNGHRGERMAGKPESGGENEIISANGVAL